MNLDMLRPAEPKATFHAQKGQLFMSYGMNIKGFFLVKNYGTYGTL